LLVTVFTAIFSQYFYRECKTDNKNALKNAIFGTKVEHRETHPKRYRRDNVEHSVEIAIKSDTKMDVFSRVKTSK